MNMRALLHQLDFSASKRWAVLDAAACRGAGRLVHARVA
jgi:hypothetical protein